MFVGLLYSNAIFRFLNRPYTIAFDMKSPDTISMQSVFVAWIKMSLFNSSPSLFLPHIQFHHFHQSMQSFPRDISSVSVIYLQFGHFSYVVHSDFFCYHLFTKPLYSPFSASSIGCICMLAKLSHMYRYTYHDLVSYWRRLAHTIY